MSSYPTYRARRVLVDTSGYFAAANRHDGQHVRGAATFRQLILDRRPLFTTNFILARHTPCC